MNDFIQLIFHMLGRAIGPAIGVMLFGTVLWAKIYDHVYHGQREFSLKQAAPVVLFAGYLGGLLTVTLLLRTTGDSAIQWHLFRSFREAWNAFTLRMWLNPLLNIGMFVPMGALLPLIARVFRRWYVTLAAGLGSSLLIEAVQYLFHLGSADVDDLFCNILGTALGFCLCMVVLSLIEKKRAAAGAYAVVPVLCAAVLAGTFILYYTQPYGNLADAPSFTADTRGVQWVLECELPDEAATAGVYWSEPFDQESCLAFGKALAQRAGLDPSSGRFDTDIYDNTIFFSDHSQFSFLADLNDCSYECTFHEVHNSMIWDDFYGEVDEAQLRAALLELGVEVPAAARFSYEGEGLHTFRADRVIEGDVLTDGTLTCLVSRDGEIGQINNDLAVCTLQATEPILSAEEAFAQLKQGNFSHGAWFESTTREEIHVASCTLDYIADSKGFRQPVYTFALKGSDSVFVPALAK